MAHLLLDYCTDFSGLLQSFCWAEPPPPISAEIICVAPINKAFIAAFVLRTVRNHYIIKNIELIILSNQWTPLVDNFCRLVSNLIWCQDQRILNITSHNIQIPKIIKAGGVNVNNLKNQQDEVIGGSGISI